MVIFLSRFLLNHLLLIYFQRLISYKSIKSLLELYRGTDWRSIVQFDKVSKLALFRK